MSGEGRPDGAMACAGTSERLMRNQFRAWEAAMGEGLDDAA